MHIELTKKKVYTLTFHDVPNIGATLQAYALQRYISSLGFNCQLVNYRPLHLQAGLLKPTKGLQRNINRLKTLINVREFSKKYIPQTEKVIWRTSQLTNLHDAFAFVSGSDQIWNTSLTGQRPDAGFFLNFPTSARKIAYAASTGAEQISTMSGDVAKYIKAYDSVSVRESFLENDLKSSNIRSDATTVLDPTYLVDSYDEILSDKVDLPDKYIFTYEVGSSKSRTRFFDVAKLARRRHGIPIVHLGSSPMLDSDIDLSPTTPGIWLRAIERSSFSITNSFHGLLFSVFFNKKFEYVPHFEESKNSRPENFLNLFGPAALTEMTHSLDNLDEPFFWKRVSPRLNDEIQKSKTFLKESLQ